MSENETRASAMSEFRERLKKGRRVYVHNHIIARATGWRTLSADGRLRMTNAEGTDVSLALPPASAVRKTGPDTFTLLGFKPEGQMVRFGGDQPFLDFHFGDPPAQAGG